MVGLRRALEILQVAADAGGVGAGQTVVAIHMALRALHAAVCASQREAGGVVIESRAGPGSRRVALLASLREAGLHVIGIGRALEILQVATDACGVGAGQVVIIINMTLGTLHAGMCPT